MITRLRIQPAPGLVVRRPTAPYSPIPMGGCTVTMDAYWQRLLNDGDIIEAPEPEPEPDPPKRKRSIKPDEVTE